MALLGQEIIHRIDDEHITISGMVHGIDTSQWSQGTDLYSSETIPGGWTDKKPETKETTFTGTVIESHVSTGNILVFPAGNR